MKNPQKVTQRVMMIQSDSGNPGWDKIFQCLAAYGFDVYDAPDGGEE